MKALYHIQIFKERGFYLKIFIIAMFERRSDPLSRIFLLLKGYGKDAAEIARHAIEYARKNQIDVVLIDTAGRMQDNEPLMRALAKVSFQ